MDVFRNEWLSWLKPKCHPAVPLNNDNILKVFDVRQPELANQRCRVNLGFNSTELFRMQLEEGRDVKEPHYSEPSPDTARVFCHHHPHHPSTDDGQVILASKSPSSLIHLSLSPTNYDMDSGPRSKPKWNLTTRSSQHQASLSTLTF